MNLHVFDRETDVLFKRSIWNRIQDESRLSKDQYPANLALKNEGPYFLFVSWLCLFGTVVHIFGTLVFSSMGFITTLDAVTVAFQFLGSIIICRAILMFELNGMTQVVRAPEAVNHHGCKCQMGRDSWVTMGPYSRCGRAELGTLMEYAPMTPKSSW
jgi:hypothetical protein